MKRTTLVTVAAALLGIGFSAGFALADPSPRADDDAVPSAQQVFNEATELIRTQYVDADIGEDELWSSAIRGILDRLVQVKGKHVNELLSPRELKVLEEGLSGEISGIGAVVEKVTDFVVIREPLPGSPAAKAGLLPNDRVLGVDGRSVAKLELGEVVGMIRGKTGTEIKLLVQRGADEQEIVVTRGPIQVDSVIGSPQGPGGFGYVRIRSFDKTTVAKLDTLLAEMKGQRAVIVDLRGSPGGLFTEALEVADRFLPQGARIMSTLGRDGKETVYEAKGPSSVAGKRVVVLIDEKTSSSGELVTAALGDHDVATLVGATTFGKGTIEKILELSNGWAIKLTTARMLSPKGETWQGRGVTPDVPVASPAEDKKLYTSVLKIDLEQDPTLKTAVSMLRVLDRDTRDMKTKTKSKQLHR